MEQFEKQTQIIAEVQTEHSKKLDKQGNKLDATFEMVGRNTENTEIIKQDTQFIKFSQTKS